MKKALLTATVQSHICQFHRPLAKLLHQNGYQVDVAARNNLAEKNGMQLDFADNVFDVNFSRSPFSKNNLAAYKQLKQILSENHYDFIHCNTPMGGVVTRLAANKYRKRGTKVFYTAHGFHFYKGAPLQNWLLYYPIEKWLARKTDKLIAINKEDFNRATEKFKTEVCRIHGVGVNIEKYRVINDDEKIKIREKVGLKAHEKVILCVGELLPNKNQATLIKAMPAILKEFPNTKLFFAGNGAEESTLKNLAEELKVAQNIVFLGYCLNLEEFQNIADVCVSCSFREGLALNLVEAMLCKTPVVASQNRGHKELVKDGKTGFLLNPTDVDGFAQKIITVLKQKNIASALADSAYENVQKYIDTNVCKELNGIYEL
ncbi:MAG: glycosyltransferase family 4 protein [Oscillospiraceae bacterium]|jgi:glycosyltransferase EpsD|nr:glycosyltransferase family 4 protein [Oscillospiraceae bacterium]